MDYAEIVKVIAPCGLSCGTCLAFAGGEIQQSAKKLAELLGPNFGDYAERLKLMNPVFGNYPQFQDMLDYLARGECRGCREQGCLFKQCKLAACVKSHGVEFCFQCPEFPCDDHGLPAFLAPRWKANNDKMRREGVEAFYAVACDKPRYP